MGLPAAQLRIARAIGVDAFLTVWRMLDEEPAYRTDKGDLQVTMRPFRSYLRYQRNRFIEALFAQGLDREQIRERVRLELCETLSKSHINRLCRGR